MKDYIKKDNWQIIEDQFFPDYNEISESLFSLGNGKMGLRGNFEEDFSGKTLQGSYNAGIYYPDKTKVGWWKNGYPEYFAKVLNSCNWIGLSFNFGNEILDLNKCNIGFFKRSLNMEEGILYRQVKATTPNGVNFSIDTHRFTSMANDEIACLDYTLRLDNYKGQLNISAFLDFDIVNKDSNYDEKFWEEVAQSSTGNDSFVHARTLKTSFELGVSQSLAIYHNGSRLNANSHNTHSKYASNQYEVDINPGDEIRITKYVGFASSLYYAPEAIQEAATTIAHNAAQTGIEALLQAHKDEWKKIWDRCDIKIEGDVSAQQGIRFNIFHLMQTYTGSDSRLNIGPKGFTGEKYGGSTYWDTEAYCLPFYQSTAPANVANQLLKYRYNHLAKAIENAENLGFSDGAALYPMVTMNGEECHNEWEITFEEIHRNGAIAYAIYDNINYQDDDSYLTQGGLEVLIGIARFWAQRVNYSVDKEKYVMLGVTGPNEYENNVNNNWYTNYIARWCLKYTSQSIELVKTKYSSAYTRILELTQLKDQELTQWQDIVNNMYLPYDPERNIFLQQDGFLDKELNTVDALKPEDRPINQNWSWDRILRSVYIKQADVLQGLYFFEEDFDLDTIRSNFDFYEPRTVHESSLSPCVHSIQANLLGKKDKAYEMYLRTSRLDLDDYNNDTEDGLHITSMAGTWMSVVKGFGGMRIKNNALHFNPSLPESWQACEFHILFRGNKLSIRMEPSGTKVHLIEGDLKEVYLAGEKIML
ncbi:MAG: glycoside hydrolase family 65 protein [Saprospiraceae bacterium]|nr:glycoside hydrolase family 65 protein [Saprospiraceae bacterium]